MKLCLKILVPLFILACSNYLHAQIIFLNEPEDKPITISTGQKKTIFYNLVGTGKDIKNLKIKLNIPGQFKLITHSQADILKTGQLHALFFTVQSENAALKGSYSADIQIFDENILLYSYGLKLEILEKRNIEIKALQKPEFIGQKNEEILKFLIKNTGNNSEKIQLSSRSGKVLSQNKITLAPGESQIIETQNILPELNTSARHLSFDLMAHIEGFEKPFVEVFTVPVYSFKFVKNDPYQRFPVQASFLYHYFWANGKPIQTPQYAFSGGGFIDANSKHRIDFIAKGPNRFDLPRFGNVDQHFVAYSNQKTKVEIGDKNFMISNLTENSRFGKGMEVVQKMGSIEAGVYYFKPRFFNEIKNNIGFYSSYQNTKKDNFRINYLNKSHIFNNQNLNSNFISATSAISREKFYVNSELSLSTTNRQASVGVFNSAYINFDRIKINSNFIHTGKSFYGYFNNSFLSSNVLHYHINKTTRVGLGNNISKLNPSLDRILFTTAPHFSSNSIDLAHDFSKKHTARIMYISGQKEDRFENKAFHYRERLTRMVYNMRYPKLEIMWDGDIGKTQNLLIQTDQGYKSDKLFRTRFYTQYNTGKNVSVGTFVEYLNTTKFRDAELKNQYLFYGVQTNAQIKNQLFFNLNYRNNFSPDELFQSQSFFDASIEYRKKYQELSLISSYGILPGLEFNKNIFVSLKYSVNLNIPLRKIKGLGKISGSISGIKKDGVVVNLNGQKIITDQYGRFEFNDLKPGTYQIMVNNSSLGFGNMVKNNPKPIEINLLEDDNKTLEFEIVKSGKISGYLADKDGKKIELENILIEVYNQHYSKISHTNKYGEFGFDELTKDQYKVRILSSEIAKKYKILNSDFIINVNEGLTSTFMFNLDPKKKNILFQDEIILLSDKK